MNRKIKLFVVLTLIIQLLIPSYLLIHHYSLIKNTLECETEYCFRLDRIDIVIPNMEYTEKDWGSVYFQIYGISRLYDKKIAVSADENGLAVVSELKNKKQTDSWFDYNYYNKNCCYYTGEFAFEPGIDAKSVINEINSEYSWLNKNNENKTYAYVTAKIYKGIFIPTAIYFSGTKIITIQNS